VEFEPTIPVFQLAKTVHTLDHVAAVIGKYEYMKTIILVAAIYRMGVKLGVSP
jgi:hypothetical protein